MAESTEVGVPTPPSEESPDPSTQTPAPAAPPTPPATPATGWAKVAQDLQQQFPGWSAEAIARQFDRQHRRIKELEGQSPQLNELRAENERLRGLAEAAVVRHPDPAPSPTPGLQGEIPAPRLPTMPPQLPPEVPNEQQIRAQERFNVHAGLVWNEIRQQHEADWPVVKANIEKLGGIPAEVMQQIIAIGSPDQAAYVLVELGKNPTKLQDMLDVGEAMSRQTQLLRMVMERPKPPTPSTRPSAAPPPPTSLPPGSGASAPIGDNLYDEKYQFDKYYRGDVEQEKAIDAAWYAEREKQKRASRGRPWSIGGVTGSRT